VRTLRYRTAHREQIREQDRQYRLRDLERYNARQRQRYDAAKRARAKAYRWANRDRLRETARRYKAAHRTYYTAPVRAQKRASDAVRRSLRRTRLVELVSIDVLYARDQGLCSLCHQAVPREQATIDHILPLSKGGEHSYRNTGLF
jgi:5-methylcytosine-specific restriction endonuclease McrA